MIKGGLLQVLKETRVERAARAAVSKLPYRWRQQPAFWRYYALLESLEFRSADELRQLQLGMLLDILRHAHDRSGFYGRLYTAHGVDINAIRSHESFSARIPMVTRSDLLMAPDLGVSMRGSRDCSTSGTSGTPFVFPSDPSSTAMEMAAVFHQWSRAGFRPGDMRVEMRGYQRRPIVEYPDHCVIRFSVIDMEQHFKAMVEYLNRRRIRFLHGYPSAIAKFALLLTDRGLSLDYEIEGVFFASENVYPWQTRLVVSTLAPRHVIAHYGNAERIALGAWCEHAQQYHFMTPYSYVERLDDGKLVGTAFLNRATPFIRYQVEDVALDWDAHPCRQCGRGYAPLVNQIGGRLEDYLVTQTGELIPPAAITYPFKQLRAIRGVQIMQERDRRVVLRCVVDEQENDARLLAEQARLRGEFQNLLGPHVPIEFETVESLPLTSAGKLQWVTSEAAPSMTREECH